MNALGKATLSIKPHHTHPDTNVVEVHYAGQLVCTVYGADGPGVRVISKHPAQLARQAPTPTINVPGGLTPGVVEVLYAIPTD